MVATAIDISGLHVCLHMQQLDYWGTAKCIEILPDEHIIDAVYRRGSFNRKSHEAVDTHPASPLKIIYDTLTESLRNDQQCETDESNNNSLGISADICTIVEQMFLAETCNPRSFRSSEISCQLTLIEYRLWSAIVPDDLFSHSKSRTADSIGQSSKFFNYLTRMIEMTIIQPETSDERALIIHSWISIGESLRELQNFQTLKAVVCALRTTPIARLKKSWDLISSQDLSMFSTLVKLTSEESNYSTYRSVLASAANIQAPLIPYIGLFFHDVTYCRASSKSTESSQEKVASQVASMTSLKKHPSYSRKLISKSLVRRRHYDMSRLSIARKPSIREEQSPYAFSYFKNASESNIEMFITHWILSYIPLTDEQINELAEDRESDGAKAIIYEQNYVSTNRIDISYLKNSSCFHWSDQLTPENSVDQSGSVVLRRKSTFSSSQRASKGKQKTQAGETLYPPQADVF